MSEQKKLSERLRELSEQAFFAGLEEEGKELQVCARHVEQENELAACKKELALRKRAWEIFVGPHRFDYHDMMDDAMEQAREEAEDVHTERG